MLLIRNATDTESSRKCFEKLKSAQKSEHLRLSSYTEHTWVSGVTASQVAGGQLEFNCGEIKKKRDL